MNLSDVSAGTPRVLKNCLDLFLGPDKNLDMRGFASAPVTPAKYDSHPDIQFFRLVKTKHHYAYHKAKRAGHDTLDKIHLQSTVFDPYSRDLLLQRLRTFNALNWNVPSPGKLNELVCASKGWVCESIVRNSNTKNHLKCCTCGNLLVLRFNVMDEQPQYAPFQFDMEDIHLLNDNLETQYLRQILELGHSSTCSWTKFQTPLSVYYLTPHISSTNEVLISDYLTVLRNLTENYAILQDHTTAYGQLVPSALVDLFSLFAKVSNMWLISKYYRENQENIAAMLDRMSAPWLYWLAAMGWDLNIQTFSSQTVLLLICSKCNQRLFLRKSDESESVPTVSSSKILTPCQFPAHIGGTSVFSTEYMDEMEEEEYDVNLGHKPWCCNLHNTGVPFYEYFMQTVIGLEKNIGANGEYLVEKDASLDLTPSKRKSSIDVSEGLDRLSKLRRLYFD